MDTYKHPLLTILLRAVLALALSALMLFVAFVLYINSRVPEGAQRPVPIAILGKDMQAVVGSAEIRGETLAITDYHAGEGELSAVAVWRGRFQAADFPLLAYQIDTASPGPVLNLIWRTSSTPEVLFSTELNGAINEESWLELARHPDWQGTVVELGVYAFAKTPDQVLSISHLTLEPADWRGFLAGHWTDWTAYRGWSTSSINYLYGTAERNALSPLLVIAVWTALAVVLLLLAGLVTGRWQPGALLAVLLLPWISVDLFWQNELSAQLAQTRNQFAGKSVQEKHLADIDGNIYRYITRLKDQVLPETPSRIIILHDSRGHNYTRLKAQYYLLPHEVYNFGKMPPKTRLDSIDYILVLGEVPGLAFHPQTSTLVWKHGKRSLAVEQVDRDPMGGLYRVLPGRPEAENKQ